MGGHSWGRLQHVRNQVWYTLSPYEQSLWHGVVKQGFPNLLRRAAQELPYILPPALFAYTVYTWANNKSYEMARKQANGSSSH